MRDLSHFQPYILSGEHYLGKAVAKRLEIFLFPGTTQPNDNLRTLITHIDRR